MLIFGGLNDLFVFSIILMALIIVILVITWLKKIALININNIIDNIFEIGYLNKTNKFIRLFISEDRKRKWNYEKTFSHREKWGKRINIISGGVIVISVVIGAIVSLTLFVVP